jgi:hypothetical protein
MNSKIEKFLFLAFASVLIGTWGINFNAEGALNAVPTITPTGLIATAVSPTQISLSWKAQTQNYGKTIVGYKIEQMLSTGAFFTLVDNTGSLITTYSITGLKTGVSYTYRVSAVYTDDSSTDPSKPATATPLVTSTPQPPLQTSSNTNNVKFDFVPSDGTTLTGAIVTPSDYLGLQYKKDSRSMIINTVSTAESINNSLDNLLSYQNSHLSPDSIPGPLIAKSISPTQINLSWLPPIQSYGQSLLGYKIELKNAPGDYRTIDDNTGNGTTNYSITGLTPGTTYTYRVSAIYTATRSNPSNEATASTLVSIPLILGQSGNTTSISPQKSSNASLPSKVSPQSNLSQSSNMPQSTTNVRFDFTAPDGTPLYGVILTQNEYQQFLVIKDPRTILSNVTQTSSTINNSLAALMRYQNLHPVQLQSGNTGVVPVSNSSQSSKTPVNIFDTPILGSIISSVAAISIVGLITWFVRTKVARKIVKEYHFTLDKFSTMEGSQIRIRNSGETIEDCVLMCERDACIWTDTKIDKPKHIYEGSVSSAKIPQEYENENPFIFVKSGKKVLRKIRFNDMAHG